MIALCLMSAAALVANGPWELEQASRPGKWMSAKVPGTVLQTLVENKVVPEPYYGLNNKYELGGRDGGFVVCGSVSSWINKNILKSHAFVGRVSCALTVGRPRVRHQWCGCSGGVVL